MIEEPNIEHLFNKKLIEEFPFLQVNPDDYSVTWLDFMPDGWRKRFGIELCRELKKELVEHNLLEEFVILDVKEKWGRLDITAMYVTDGVMEILDAYEEYSRTVCCKCGKPATKISTGWICPWCDDCAAEIGGSFHDIK